MLVRIVLWDLTGSDATIESLRHYLRDESVEAFRQVEGLRLKAWISDEDTDRWGAVYLWDSPEAAVQPLPSRARELIGKDPAMRADFQLEATVEGAAVESALAGLGLVFERP